MPSRGIERSRGAPHTSPARSPRFLHTHTSPHMTQTPSTPRKSFYLPSVGRRPKQMRRRHTRIYVAYPHSIAVYVCREVHVKRLPGVTSCVFPPSCKTRTCFVACFFVLRSRVMKCTLFLSSYYNPRACWCSALFCLVASRFVSLWCDTVVAHLPLFFFINNAHLLFSRP